MTSLIVSIAEIKTVLTQNYVTYLKYVRVKGEYRFAFAGEWLTPDHRKMLAAGEIAEAAAYCKVYRATESKPLLVEVEGYSSTLALFSTADDEENIRKLLS